jgi:hypothetical protein
MWFGAGYAHGWLFIWYSLLYYGHLLRLFMHISSIWRYGVVFVVTGEEILCVVSAVYFVGV